MKGTELSHRNTDLLQNFVNIHLVTFNALGSLLLLPSFLDWLLLSLDNLHRLLLRLGLSSLLLYSLGRHSKRKK
jgi:hypothetical protein